MNEKVQYDDEYGTCTQTWCEFRVLFSDLKFEEDKLLTFTGTGLEMEEEKRAWAYSTVNQMNSRDARRHCDYFLSLLDAQRTTLSTLRERGCQFELRCIWYSKQGHGGPMFTARQLKLMAELGIDFSFEFH